MAGQRWRIPLFVVLAAAAGWAVGSTASWRGLLGLAILAGVVITGTLVAWVVVIPGRLAPPLPAQELAQIKDPKARLETADARLRLRHDLRNGGLQTLAVVAVLAGAVLGFWQLAEDRSTAAADRELTRQGQASERFTRAISQLGEKQPLETRIGAISAVRSSLKRTWAVRTLATRTSAEQLWMARTSTMRSSATRVSSAPTYTRPI